MKYFFSSILLAFVLLSLPAQAQYRIGISMDHQDDPFKRRLRDSILQQVGENKTLDAELVSADSDAEKQARQVDEFLSQGIDGLVIIPVYGNSQYIIDQASMNDVPVVFINIIPDAQQFHGFVSNVVSNDLVAGRLQMRKLAHLMDGRGKLVLLRGEDDHPAALGRTKGVKEVLRSYPQIELVKEETAQWSRERAANIVKRWIDMGIKIDAVAASNDEMALGAIQAFKESNVPLNSVHVGGVDASIAALESIQAGEMSLTILQNVERQVIDGIENISKMIRGEFVDLYHWVPYELVIKGNLHAYTENQ